MQKTCTLAPLLFCVLTAAAQETMSFDPDSQVCLSREALVGLTKLEGCAKSLACDVKRQRFEAQCHLPRTTPELTGSFVTAPLQLREHSSEVGPIYSIQWNRQTLHALKATVRIHRSQPESQTDAYRILNEETRRDSVKIVGLCPSGKAFSIMKEHSSTTLIGYGPAGAVNAQNREEAIRKACNS